ncbi:hypothetical protein P280DRAFT_493589 [Massarina eburnea CBS 473.64]|uniref:Uncharacterized protein n=1 Tax=Massarina eburnea CBS 473.64 TaxID=1395130 RepID=A0A6A6RM55_9PLEO|nr:hypothetical protein P280DRAFT_493589 [Massarina eburnea CBS 473.64]
MGIGETITVINKSGKVVSTSKHIVNVFKEAKSAYRERKAEIKAERNAAAASDKALRESVKAIRMDDDDVRSRTSSRHSKHSKGTHRSKSHRHHSRPPLERGFTDSFYANDDAANNHFEMDLAGDAAEGHRKELVRRHTEAEGATERDARKDSKIDMDLAYGDLPPPLPSKKYDDSELRDTASKLTQLLDEADCLQHSVSTMIENLQENPDALAAVALTLAEISAMLAKMGPGVLMSFKGAFPAVVALLASPQFMIAAGVGVGVTIVALGGFKIIKKLQSKKEEEVPMAYAVQPVQPVQPVQMQSAPAPQQQQQQQHQIQAQPARAESFAGLDELEPPELGRIELWRRGIADVEADSHGTNVEGEFITPGATKHLVSEGVLDEDDIKSRRSTKSRKHKSDDSKSHRTSPKSVKSSSTSKTKKTEKTDKSEKKHRKSSSSSSSSGVSRSSTMKAEKKKEPSLIKTLFRSHTMAA